MNNRIAHALVFLAALSVPQLVRCENQYLQHNLVSDIPGLADRVDPNLVNPWGIAASSTSPFWILDNRKGLATVYDSAGKPAPLVVTVPPASGAGPSAPTGQVFNGGSGFVLPDGKPAVFLFCTEDGAISGWHNGIERNNAVIVVGSSGSRAVYTGLALGTTDSGPVLYAANFSAAAVDVFDGAFSPTTLPGAFKDPGIPAGFAPFNVQAIGQTIYVSYARQDGKPSGPSGDDNGYIDAFDSNGRLLRRLVSGGRLNSPWGMTIAPDGFGSFSKALLVGNFGDGTINAYNASTGDFLGTLQDAAGKAIVNTGLWALQFGNGNSGGDATTLYFTAGVSGPGGDAVESHGLFGSIQAAPILATDQVFNAAGFQKEVAPYTWVTVTGRNLAATTRSWQDSDFKSNRLPTELDGVSLTIDKKPVYVAYVSPTQLNFLTPAGLGTGDFVIETRSGGLTGNSITVHVQTLSPALFKQSEKYALATHADNSLVTPEKPAQPAEVIVLYGNGFGPTDPAIVDGAVVTSSSAVIGPVDVSIGGVRAEIAFEGLTGTGVYQVNVKLPAGLPAGDAAILIQAAGFQSPNAVFIPVAAPAPVAPPPTPAPLPPPLGYAAQIDNFQFIPDPLNVTAGGKLTWTNNQGVAHTVVSDAGLFKSQVLEPGDTFSTTLSAPGTYSYHCSIHPFMKGQIVVK